MADSSTGKSVLYFIHSDLMVTIPWPHHFTVCPCQIRIQNDYCLPVLFKPMTIVPAYCGHHTRYVALCRNLVYHQSVFNHAWRMICFPCRASPVYIRLVTIYLFTAMCRDGDTGGNVVEKNSILFSSNLYFMKYLRVCFLISILHLDE